MLSPPCSYAHALNLLFSPPLFLPPLQHEYCETVDDFLQRRTRLAFLDAAAAIAAAPRVAQIMGAELGWSKERVSQETEAARSALQKSFFSRP